MDLLVHRKHNRMFFKQDNGTKKCGRKVCTVCKHMRVSEHFSNKSGEKYTLKEKLTANLKMSFTEFTANDAMK